MIELALLWVLIVLMCLPAFLTQRDEHEFDDVFRPPPRGRRGKVIK